MTQIRIKRVYDPEARDDGYRVLVDKLWPRGMRKESLYYDLWAKDIAPSTVLRQWYHTDPEGNWAEFRKRYLAELRHSSAAQDFVAKIRSHPTVTLLYAAKDTAHNHALVLQSYLQDALK